MVDRDNVGSGRSPAVTVWTSVAHVGWPGAFGSFWVAVFVAAGAGTVDNPVTTSFIGLAVVFLLGQASYLWTYPEESVENGLLIINHVRGFKRLDSETDGVFAMVVDAVLGFVFLAALLS